MLKVVKIWFVSKGSCLIKHGTDTNSPGSFILKKLNTDEVIRIGVGDWHQVYNVSEKPCHIIEIQYGKETTEDDIERLEYYDG